MKLGVKPYVATVEWEASPAGDLVADSVVALILHAQGSAASIRLTSQPCRHRTIDEAPSKRVKVEEGSESVAQDRLRLIYRVLKEQFQHVEAVYESLSGTYEVSTDSALDASALDDDGKLKCSVRVVFSDSTGADAKVAVESRDSKLASNIQLTIQNVVTAVAAVQSTSNSS